MAAASQGRVVVVQLLRDKGADTEAEDDVSLTRNLCPLISMIRRLRKSPSVILAM